MIVNWHEFEKLDIRAGTIITASNFHKAMKPAYQLNIDFGDAGIKKSSAQITTHYKPEELIGKQVLAVINFPPRQIADFISECLVLGLYDDDNAVILLKPERAVKNGSKVG
ncbi:MAG: tRNA-binding protein [Chitinophagaceae bacterium]